MAQIDDDFNMNTLNNKKNEWNAATRTGSYKFVHCKFATTLQGDRFRKYAFEIRSSGVHTYPS